MVRKLYIALFVALLCSCSDRFQVLGLLFPLGDVVDARFEQSMDMTNDNAVEEYNSNSDAYSFYVCTDVHIKTTADRFTQYLNVLRNDSSALFGVVLGDYTSKHSLLPSFLDAMSFNPVQQQYNQDIHLVLGNHDTYFAGWDEYREKIGPSVYYWVMNTSDGNDLYIVLDSATGTLGSKQHDWLKNFLAAHRHLYRHCIICTHTNIFYTDNSQTTSGNIPMEEVLALVDMFEKYQVTLVLQGHDHYREDIYVGSVRYTIVGAISDNHTDTPAEFLRVDVSHKGIEYEWYLID